MSRRVTKPEIRGLVADVDRLAHQLGLMPEDYRLFIQFGSRVDGQPHYLYIERFTDSGRQRQSLPDFLPNTLRHQSTTTEVYNTVLATKRALAAVANHLDREGAWSPPGS